MHRDRLHAGHADKKTTQQALQTCLGSSSMLVFNFRIGKKKKVVIDKFLFLIRVVVLSMFLFCFVFETDSHVCL